MNVLDEEVFAVILAVSVIGSVLAASVALRPEPVEPFTSLGLLNSECKIGEYPREVYAGGEVELCVLVYNYVGYPVLAQVRYKIADRESIPTNTTPSRTAVLMNVTAVVPHRGELLRKIRVPIPKEVKPADRVALVFELWLYDPRGGAWVYSGRWTHLYVRVVEVW